MYQAISRNIPQYTDKDFISDYAFTRCLLNSLPDDLRDDLNAIDFSSEFLYDVGGLASQYITFDSLSMIRARDIVNETYDFQEGRKLYISGCI
jgi:hypothetical protein